VSEPNQPPTGNDAPPVIPYSAHEPGEEAEQMAQPAPPPQPPPAPRQISSRVLARSWREPTVRFWWLSAALLLAIGLWYAWDQVAQYQTEKQLIENGTRVSALITDADGDSVPGHKAPPGTPCTMVFQLDGKQVEVNGSLVPRDDRDFVIIRSTVILHVDPSDPAKWTNRSEPEPILRRMIGGEIVVLPILAATLVLALFARRRVLRFWRAEPAALFAVEHVRTGPIAPLSHAVNCAPLSGRDRRTTTIYLPGSYRKPQPGELLWLIHPAGSTSGAIAAAVYEDPASSLAGRA